MNERAMLNDEALLNQRELIKISLLKKFIKRCTLYDYFLKIQNSNPFCLRNGVLFLEFFKQIFSPATELTEYA